MRSYHPYEGLDSTTTVDIH